jgi:hypothetical protein
LILTSATSWLSKNQKKRIRVDLFSYLATVKPMDRSYLPNLPILAFSVNGQILSVGGKNPFILLLMMILFTTF